MKRTLAIVAAIAVGLTLSACGSDKAAPAASKTPAYIESAPPVASAATSDVDYRKDIGPVTVERADSPEGRSIHLTFDITNKGDKAATYEIIFGVYDEDDAKAQVGSVLVNTYDSGPTKPGAVLRVDGRYGMDEGTVPETFTVEVQSVDKLRARV